MDPISLARMATQTLSPAFTALPRPVLFFFKSVQWLHLAWTGHRYLKVATDPKHFMTSLMARGVDTLIERSGLQAVRDAAFWALVAERALQCAEQAKEVACAWNRLCETARGHHFSSKPFRLSKNQRCSCLSPSTLLWLHSLKHSTVGRVALLIRLVFRDLIAAMLLLSVRMMDTALLFSLDKKDVHPIQNLTMDYLNNGRSSIAERLKGQEEVLTPMFKMFNCSYDYAKLMKDVAPIEVVVRAVHSTHLQRVMSICMTTVTSALRIGGEPVPSPKHIPRIPDEKSWKIEL